MGCVRYGEKDDTEMFHDDQQDYYDPSYKIFTKEGGQPRPAKHLLACSLSSSSHVGGADWELFGDNCKAERCLVWIIFSNDELKALKAFETIKYVKCSLACKVVSH